ncbi:MAG TPA: VTT domain-containing protein [Chloroflexota bacterium]
MTVIQGLHGTIAILLICAVLFVEESGVPLPLVPGDALLIAAGVLIANGSISPWVFFPAAFVAVLGGALTAYTWSRTIGATAVQAMAQRFRADRALARASSWLRTAGPFRIAGARLMPGLRVYTAIVSGTAGVDLRIFLVGVVPAIVLWLGVFTVIGILVGIPALASLSHVQHLAVTGAGLVAIGALTFLGVRHIPQGEVAAPALRRVSLHWLVVLSIGIDLIIAVSVISGFIELLHEGFGLDDPDGIIDLALITGVIILFYVGVARRLIGSTAGERLLGVRYASHW